MILNLSGELMSDDWAELYRDFGYEAGFFCPGDVRKAMAQLTDGEELVLEINSIGGLVDGGAEIYSLIESCKNPTRAVIQSMAASAASYMIMACDRIDICLPAQMMIHCARGGGPGNSRVHRQAAQCLDTCDEAILNCYEKRCAGKLSREELRAMMEAETYIGARDAVSYGLADGVVGDAEEASEDGMIAASVCGNIVRAMRVLPDIGQLKAKREQQQSDAQRLELARETLRFADLEGLESGLLEDIYASPRGGPLSQLR